MRLKFYILVLLLAACGPVAQAQVLGPAMETHRLEIGFFYKWYNRDFGSSPVGEADWSAGSVYLRYGAIRWLTLSLEGGISTVHHDDFPDLNYRRYTLGVGGTSTLLAVRKVEIAVSLHYHDTFDFDRSSSGFHKNTRGVVAALQLERPFLIYEQSITIWGGPAYVYDESRQYPGVPGVLKDDSTDNVGFVVGANGLFRNHVSMFFQLVYANNFQPRAGLGYRF